METRASTLFFLSAIVTLTFLTKGFVAIINILRNTPLPTKASHPRKDVYERDVHHHPLYINELNHWSFYPEKKYWVWARNSSEKETYQIPTNSPYSRQPFNNFRLKNSTKVVLYGSSHLREIYFSLIRLERGLKFNEPLEEEVRNVGSRPTSGIPNQLICDKEKSGWVDGMYGLNIQACGFPGKRLVPELGPNVAIGFKTFLHTPDAERAFLGFLEQKSMADPNVVVVDVGIWGPRGKRIGDSNATDFVMERVDELRYYLDWVSTTFSKAFVLLIYEKDDWMFQTLNEFVQKSSKYFFWRKDRLLKTRPTSMPCEHGCGGPLMEVMARQLLEFLFLIHNTEITK